MSDFQENTDQISNIVSEYFDIDSVLWGEKGRHFVVRIEGKLKGDSLEAHQSLSKTLGDQKLSVYFLEEENTQVIELRPAPPQPRKSNPMVNLVLFIFTLISMLIAGVFYSFEGPQPNGMAEIFEIIIANLGSGSSFALSLLAILLAHEFGHYLAGRYHNTAVTLPYFLPFPFSPFGTLGAFIQLKEPPKNRRELLDIGLAGPMAGLVIAIPILLLGLSLSDLNTIPTIVGPGEGLSFEGNSLLYLAAKYVIHGELLPSPASYGGLSPAIYWIRYFFTGLPTPLGGTDVFLHPMAWAGWAGLLVTALNLIPAGQLDGGHLLYSLLGKRARNALPIIFLALGILGLFWRGWWLWVFLIFMMGSGHAQPRDEITQLDDRRKALAILGLIVFVLVFTPIPLQAVFGP